MKGCDEYVQKPKFKQSRTHKLVDKGIDKPLPKLKCIEGNAFEVGSCTRDYYCISVPPGSRLALRLPHLAKQVEGQPNVQST